MYYPYFRGMQYDLITIRENAERMDRANIIPIIEPVKRNLSGLSHSIEKLVVHNRNYMQLPLRFDLFGFNLGLHL